MPQFTRIENNIQIKMISGRPFQQPLRFSIGCHRKVDKIRQQATYHIYCSKKGGRIKKSIKKPFKFFFDLITVFNKVLIKFIEI